MKNWKLSCLLDTWFLLELASGSDGLLVQILNLWHARVTPSHQPPCTPHTHTHPECMEVAPPLLTQIIATKLTVLYLALKTKLNP